MKRFSYNSKVLRIIKPVCLSLSFKLTDFLNIIYNVKDIIVEISVLPEKEVYLIMETRSVNILKMEH